MKASAFRRWPVAGAYSLEQTTRLTGGSDFLWGYGKCFPLKFHFRAFLKCNRHFDEFLFHEKMARKMEDFPCIRLAFWRGRGQAG